MHKTVHEPSQDSIRAGYEVSDLNVRGVFWLIGAVFLLAIGGFITTIFVIKSFDKARRADVAVSPVADPSLQRPGVSYILQVDPVADKARLFAAQQEKLDSFGSNDAAIGHMPVERAIDILSSGEAPYRQEPTQARISADTDLAPPAPLVPAEEPNQDAPAL